MSKPYDIAVIDDDESVCKALKRLLSSAGYDASTFTRGAEFLRSVETQRPDCVVLDVHMPGMTGLDVLARLKDSYPDLPVVIITAYDDPETHQKALKAGALFLRKPFNDQALLDAIHDALGPRPVPGGSR